MHQHISSICGCVTVQPAVLLLPRNVSSTLLLSGCCSWLCHATCYNSQASPGRLSAFEDALFRGSAAAAGSGDAGLSAAAAAAAEVPLLAAVWLGSSEGQRVVGVAFLDAATRYAW
jgi:hypothetical protein